MGATAGRGGTGASNQLVVKKYGNRRLYDTEASRYITLDELASMLEQGRDVRVVDAKSGADLTKSVLLQIIAEQEKDRDLLPVAFLKQLIQLGDASMRDALQRYLGFGLGAFLDAQKQMEQRYRDFAGSFLNPFAMFAQGRGEPGAAMGGAPVPQGAPPEPHPVPEPPAAPEEPSPEPVEATDDSDAPPASELEALKAQMAEMQKLLAKLQK